MMSGINVIHLRIYQEVIPIIINKRREKCIVKGMVRFPS